MGRTTEFYNLLDRRRLTVDFPDPGMPQTPIMNLDFRLVFYYYAFSSFTILIALETWSSKFSYSPFAFCMI